MNEPLQTNETAARQDLPRQETAARIAAMAAEEDSFEDFSDREAPPPDKKEMDREEAAQPEAAYGMKRREKQRKAGQTLSELHKTIRAAEKRLGDLQKREETLRLRCQNFEEQIEAAKNAIRSNQSSAEAILAEAEQSAQLTATSAAAERDNIIHTAEKKKNEIIDDAQKESARIREEADRHKTEIEKQAEEAAADLIRTCLPDYKNKVQDALEEQRQDVADLQKQLADSANAVKLRAEEKLTAMIPQLSRALTDFSDTITESLQTSFVNYGRHLADALTQSINAIFTMEYVPITRVFQNLRRVQSDMEKKLEENRERYENCRQAEEEPDAQTQELLSLIRQLLEQAATNAYNMKMLKNSFADALAVIGVYEFRPSPGEPFDEYVHACADRETDPYGKRIRRTVLSGLKIKTGDRDAAEDEALIKAEVEVEEDPDAK